ncbi:MAG TPA: hypothetical protein VM308_01040 [Sphingomicrobium sp.]|nr:hypothetical protein [Sphingomicrobium sp.]
MRRTAIVLALLLWGCGRGGDAPASAPEAQPGPAAADTMAAPAGGQSPMKAALIEVPGDKQQLERMLAMGYTVHEDHMHAPGVKECPFNMGGSVVQ